MQVGIKGERSIEKIMIVAEDCKSDSGFRFMLLRSVSDSRSLSISVSVFVSVSVSVSVTVCLSVCPSLCRALPLSHAHTFIQFMCVNAPASVHIHFFKERIQILFDLQLADPQVVCT